MVKEEIKTALMEIKRTKSFTVQSPLSIRRGSRTPPPLPAEDTKIYRCSNTTGVVFAYKLHTHILPHTLNHL